MTSECWFAVDGKRAEKISKTDLHAFLRSAGLDMAFHERFVVLQNRTIALVERGPNKLMELLERLIGTYELRHQVALLVRVFAALCPSRCSPAIPD